MTTRSKLRRLERLSSGFQELQAEKATCLRGTETVFVNPVQEGVHFEVKNLEIYEGLCVIFLR